MFDFREGKWTRFVYNNLNMLDSNYDEFKNKNMLKLKCIYSEKKKRQRKKNESPSDKTQKKNLPLKKKRQSNDQTKIILSLCVSL